MADVRGAFRDAANHLVALAARVPADAWERPGLGVWTVRELTGHATRALLTVEQYLAEATDGDPELRSAAAYFLALLSSVPADQKAALNAGVAARGRQDGAALGPDPAAEVGAIAARVLATLDAASDAAVVPTRGGTIRLIDYLPTRVFELTVHALDLAAALSDPIQPPATALGVTFELTAALALGQGWAGAILLALTGRQPLPARFSIL